MSIEVMWLDSNLHSMAPGIGTYVQSTTVFPVGVPVNVTVEGTYNVFSATTLQPVHIPVQWPSPGNNHPSDAALDADVWFADNGSGAGRPSHTTELRWDLNEGAASFAHIEPIGGPFGAPQPGNIYNYTITGQGFRFRAAIMDTPIGDNTGLLKITMEVPTGWVIGFGPMGDLVSPGWQ